MAEHEALEIELALERYLGNDRKAVALARAITQAVQSFEADGWAWTGANLCEGCRDVVQDAIESDEGRILQHLAAELRTPECYEDRMPNPPTVTVKE